MQPVKSDHMKAVGYNDATNILTIIFNGSEPYEYRNVPRALFDELLAAQPHPTRRVFYPKIRYSYQYRPFGTTAWQTPAKKGRRR